MKIKIFLWKKKKKSFIFFPGQIYDAYRFLIKLIKKSNYSIIIIDNYIDDSILDMITKKKKEVSITILTRSHSLSKLDLEKFKQQYSKINLITSNQYHDRFLIIDHKELYHIGSSLKDLGKKCFVISKLEDPEIRKALLHNIKGF